METIKKKGNIYVKNLPLQHCLKTLFNFDIAFLLFWIARTILGKRFPLSKIVLSFLTWDNIDNSSWYIFTVIMLYLLTFVSFIFVRKKYALGAVFITILTVVFILTIMRYKHGTWWYNTALCYPLGIWYSLIHVKFENLIKKVPLVWWCSLSIFTAMFFKLHSQKGLWMYECLSCTFAIVIVLISMKVQIINSMNTFFGNKIFCIYILQRIPMNVLLRFMNFNKHVVAAFVLTLLSTIMLSLIFDYVVSKIDHVIFGRLKFS